MDQIGTPTPTMLFQPTGIGLAAPVHSTYYATKTLTHGVAMPSQLDFFTSSPSPDLTLDRYDQANVLVQSGKTLVIYGVGLVIYPTPGGTAPSLADYMNIINRCASQFTCNTTEFGIFPILNFPAGGGAFMASGQVNVAPSATPGALESSGVGIANGFPFRKRLQLCYPLKIQTNQKFKWTLIGPQTTPYTPDGDLSLRLELEVAETRMAS